MPQRPHAGSTKGKLRQLARLQHLSVSHRPSRSPVIFFGMSPITVCASTSKPFTLPVSPYTVGGTALPSILLAMWTIVVDKDAGTGTSATTKTMLPDVMQICSQSILGQLQLDDVWFCLLRHATKSPHSPDDSRLHYDDFCQVHHCLLIVDSAVYHCSNSPHPSPLWRLLQSSFQMGIMSVIPVQAWRIPYSASCGWLHVYKVPLRSCQPGRVSQYCTSHN